MMRIFIVGNSGATIPTSQEVMRKGFEDAGFPSRVLGGKGTEYTMPDGSRARLMEPTQYAPRRTSFENANGQPIDPFTGKPPQPPRAMSRAERKEYVRKRTHVEQAS
ncbi:MAG: hypothetical protein GY862_05220 [Gammaproteobacteria bacterium]|nr:hypothetical protein [Gammaproteobacteria bacterium]